MHPNICASIIFKTGKPASSAGMLTFIALIPHLENSLITLKLSGRFNVSLIGDIKMLMVVHSKMHVNVSKNWFNKVGNSKCMLTAPLYMYMYIEVWLKSV